jgi:BirA family transcriptional regulator, biotin operon repressor / biotin---[acetyl-CoA-carboxylase] ligase
MDFPRDAGGVPVRFFESLGSTNEEALTRARAGEGGPLWIAAARQTAGRGRRGRRWTSEPGNLYASLLLDDPAPPALAPQICFVAALALHDAVLDTCAGLAPARLKLKWPNDLLLDEAKAAGILVEGVTVGSRSAVVVGFGVNCRSHPHDTPYLATDFAAADLQLTAPALLARLGVTWTARSREWARGQGFAAVRSAFLARVTGIGAQIEARLHDRAVAGRFEGIDERGALVLINADGERVTVAAGDVFPMLAGAA